MDPPFAYFADRLHTDRVVEGLSAANHHRARAARGQGPSAPPLSAVRGLLSTETRLFLRDVPAAIFALIIPALILLGAGLAIPGMREPLKDPRWEGLTLIQSFTPAVLTMALATPALSSLPGAMANYREHGVLRRLATTPVRPSAVLVAHVVIAIAAFALASTLTLVLGAAVFDSPMPRQTVLAVVSLLVGAVAMFGVGLVIAARARTGATASGIGMLCYFPLLFFAGMWTPGPTMPQLLHEIATFTPTGATSQALTAAWFNSDVPATQLLVLLAWAALLYPLAAKSFRWS